MGCCSSTDDKAKSQDIDKQLKSEHDRMNNEVKLLLLGAYCDCLRPALLFCTL